jgi:hypothetical protein
MRFQAPALNAMRIFRFEERLRPKARPEAA